MSHFTCLVILGEQEPHSEEIVNDAISRLLEPYNENGQWFREGSKWDWWVIGGRWTGALTGYNPQADEVNYEKCSICDGTGVRKPIMADERDLSVEQMREKMAWCGGCNGCSGKGLALKWHSEWKKRDDNVMQIARIRQDFQPYSVVTPDGKWYDSGSMGWFGIQREQTMTDEAWSDQWKRLREAYANHWAVLVDCHV